ncbi:MAG: methyltransferase [bacterium]|nr:methyltransferase [bacterium]
MYGLTFIKQFLANPATVGAVAPSSSILARMVCEAAEVADADAVVEFGPGTGSITQSVLDTLKPDAAYLGLEINPDFCEILANRFPNGTFYNDSAENTRTHLESRGLSSCDCIVSGLPWSAFPEELQDSLLDAVADVLRPGGRFATYMYIQSPYLAAGRHFIEKLGRRFGGVDRTRLVWRNIPPAHVYHIQK